MAKSKGKKLPILVILLLLVGIISFVGWSFFSSDPGGTDLNAGKIKYEIPKLEELVSVNEDLKVPANHVMVLLEEDASLKDISEVAKLVDGEVVGEFEYLKLYQIKTGSKTLEELNKDIEKIKESKYVEFAGYHTHSSNKVEIKGTPCKLLEDLYENEAHANPYEMIGLERAWQYINATGVKLNKVKVGVADTGLHIESSDGEAGPKIRALNKDDEQKSTSHYNSHGTMVSNVVGAGWRNSGMRGVAGGLDDNLEVLVSRLPKNNQKYVEISQEDYDPENPTHVMRNNKSYLVSNLHEIMKQIEGGAEVINYSWGSPKPESANNFDNQVYRRFLEKIQEDNPKVVFVAAAGNEARIQVTNEETGEKEWVEGEKLDGSNYDMGGTPVDNLITVGSLDADGKVSNFSNRVTGDGEVTINAQGRAVPTGFNPDGTAKTGNGTSFSTPQVSGAVAILKSINPELTAIEIKNILRETADTSFKDVEIEAESGGRVMRLDKAVLRVLSEVLEEDLDGEKLLAVSVINSVAKQNPKDVMNYNIVAVLPEVRKTPVEVELSFSGQGSLGGSTKRSVSSPSDIEWDWTFLSNEDTVYITITRKDSKACTRLYIEPNNFAGTYEGSISVAFPDFEYFIEDFVTTGGTRNVDVPVKIVIDDKGDATFSFTSKGNIDFSAPGVPMSMDYDASGDIPGKIDEKGKLKFKGEYIGGYKMNLPEVYGSIMSSEYLANLTGKMTGLCDADGSLEKEVINGTVNFTSSEGHKSSASYTATKIK